MSLRLRAGPQPEARIRSTTVRIVTWNLWAGDTQAKLAKLTPRPDIGVFCEVSKTYPPLTDQPASDWVWTGRLTDRGVAVASWSGHLSLVHPPDGAEAGCHAVGVQLASGISVVGLWACPEQKGRSYGAEVHSTIDVYERLLRSQRCVFAGDFNMSLGGEADRRLGVTKRLDELGYTSAYHAFHAADFGSEPATYFHQFKRDKPFHIDLVFVPTEWVPAIRSVEIAPYDGWVGPGLLRSDHVPVAVELDLRSFD